MIVRIIIIAAAAIGGGLAFGRRMLDREIEKKLPSEIEAAQSAAIIELNKKLSQVIHERLISFGINLTIKAGLLGGVYWLYRTEHLTAPGLHIVVALFIVAFLVRDSLRTLPYLLPAWRLARAHQWNPRIAFKEFVASIAFERAYVEAMKVMDAGTNQLWLTFSKYSAKNLSEEVAQAVANVAREASFEKVKARAILSACLAAIMFLAYSAFIFFIMKI